MTDEYEYITEHWEEIKAHETPCEAVLEALGRQDARHRELETMLPIAPQEEGGARYAAAEGLLRALRVQRLSIQAVLNAQTKMREKIPPVMHPEDTVKRLTRIAVQTIAHDYVRTHAEGIDAEVTVGRAGANPMEVEMDLFAAMMRSTENALEAAAAREGYDEGDAGMSAACTVVAYAILEKVEMILYGEDDDVRRRDCR